MVKKDSLQCDKKFFFDHDTVGENPYGVIFIYKIFTKLQQEKRVTSRRIEMQKRLQGFKDQGELEASQSRSG
jgi:hypothetical protein